MSRENPTSAEMFANGAAMRGILARRIGELERVENKTAEQAADLERLRAALSKVEAAWQPTAQA